MEAGALVVRRAGAAVGGHVEGAIAIIGTVDAVKFAVTLIPLIVRT